jgi:threonine/homoserine/homoserine lactone efflux protein
MIFALVTSITPGPNNYLLFSYGKKYGFRDSYYLMLGIFTGFLVLLYASGYGIAGLITANKIIGVILKIASSAWLFYLAIVLSKLNSNMTETSDFKAGFYEGFLMQFVNPKAWIMAITGAGAFLPQLHNIHLSVFIFSFSFGLVGIPCMIVWIYFGDLISKILKSERANKVLGIILFILMFFSIIMIWL